MRKADMSLGIIVAIVIGVLIMTLLVILIGGGFRDINTQSSSCLDTFRGSCQYTASECRAQQGVVVAGASCGSEGVPGAACCQLGASGPPN